MEFTVKTESREEIIDILEQVASVLSKEALDSSKACLIHTPHTTCAILINEIADKNVQKDILSFLKDSVPRGRWLHDEEDGNADAHIKSSLIGQTKTLPIENGKLALGVWQSIALAEFDGPRERKVIVKII